MAHIAQTLIRQQEAHEAYNPKSSYEKYTELVDNALKQGFTTEQIIAELEMEKKKIFNDQREGDAIFKSGFANVKASCLNALALIISELKGEN